MRGIEAATAGVLAGDVELKTSRTGKPYANLSLAIDAGQDDEGRKLTTWLRCTVFNETAELLARTAQKGSKIYCEGKLSLSEWQDKTTGAQRHGLSLAAWKAQVVGASAIGRNRKRRESGDTFKDGAARQLKGASFAIESAPMPESQPYRRERPRIIGRDDFNDELPW
jgi:single stranded DNA-binding protein